MNAKCNIHKNKLEKYQKHKAQQQRPLDVDPRSQTFQPTISSRGMFPPRHQCLVLDHIRCAVARDYIIRAARTINRLNPVRLGLAITSPPQTPRPEKLPKAKANVHEPQPGPCVLSGMDGMEAENMSLSALKLLNAKSIRHSMRQLYLNTDTMLCTRAIETTNLGCTEAQKHRRNFSSRDHAARGNRLNPPPHKSRARTRGLDSCMKVLAGHMRARGYAMSLALRWGGCSRTL